MEAETPREAPAPDPPKQPLPPEYSFSLPVDLMPLTQQAAEIHISTRPMGAWSPTNVTNAAALAAWSPTHTAAIAAADAPPVRWRWYNLAASMLSMSFCLVFGIIATVQSILAYVDHKARDFDRSRRKRNWALGFGMAAILLGTLAVGVVTIGVIMYGKRHHVAPGAVIRNMIQVILH